MSYRPRYFDGVVMTPAIVPGAVTEEKIADEAITSAKIKDETIQSVDIGPGQVRTEDISDGAVTRAKLGEDVSIVPLEDGSVTNTKIAVGAVDSARLANGAVGADKIALGAVTSTKIADGAVIASKIATNAVSKSKMTDNSVGYLEIINGSVEPRHIRSVDTPANGEVPSYNQLQERFEWISPGGGVSRPITPPVATGEIAIGAVDGERLAVSAVTKAKLSYKVVSITVPIGAIGRTEPPAGDPELVNGVILGYYPTGNQDQFVDTIVLNPDGSITINLGGSALNDNTFNVVVLRA